MMKEIANGMPIWIAAPGAPQLLRVVTKLRVRRTTNLRRNRMAKVMVE